MALALLKVSLDWPVRPDLAGENTKIGGLALKTLKKLKGAKLGRPLSSIVDAKAIGRGPTAPSNNWCKRWTVSSLGSRLNICFQS